MFHSVPVELLCELALFLPAQDVCRLLSVDSRTRAALSRGALWARLAERDFGVSVGREEEDARGAYIVLHTGGEWTLPPWRSLEDLAARYSSQQLSEEFASERAPMFSFVGHSGAGKTCLLISWIEGTFPSEYVPTVFHGFSCSMQLEGAGFAEGCGPPISLRPTDTTSGRHVGRQRRREIADSDLFVICIAERDFEANAREYYGEARMVAPNAYFVVALLKDDLFRTDFRLKRRVAEFARGLERCVAFRCVWAKHEIDVFMRDVVKSAVRSRLGF